MASEEKLPAELASRFEWFDAWAGHHFLHELFSQSEVAIARLFTDLANEGLATWGMARSLCAEIDKEKPVWTALGPKERGAFTDAIWSGAKTGDERYAWLRAVVTVLRANLCKFYLKRPSSRAEHPFVGRVVEREGARLEARFGEEACARLFAWFFSDADEGNRVAYAFGLKRLGYALHGLPRPMWDAGLRAVSSDRAREEVLFHATRGSATEGRFASAKCREMLFLARGAREARDDPAAIPKTCRELFALDDGTLANVLMEYGPVTFANLVKRDREAVKAVGERATGFPDFLSSTILGTFKHPFRVRDLDPREETVAIRARIRVERVLAADGGEGT